jgi:hypothetical protein
VTLAADVQQGAKHMKHRAEDFCTIWCETVLLRDVKVGLVMTGGPNLSFFSMKVLQAAVALGFLVAPAPLLASTNADIDAKGTAPTFCNVSNDKGAISMAISPAGDALSGTGRFSYVANGNAKLVLSAIGQDVPQGAADSIPSIALADLVVNRSTTAEAVSKPSGGVIRQEGDITASIVQNNETRLLTAGDYALKATATCTSL